MYPRSTFILQCEARTEFECTLNQVRNPQCLPGLGSLIFIRLSKGENKIKMINRCDWIS